jgi:hypothetical protein
MNTGKTYYDSDGNECSIWQMVHREPEWAATRIQVGEKALDQVRDLTKKIKELEAQLEENHARAESIIEARESKIIDLWEAYTENKDYMSYKGLHTHVEYSFDDAVFCGKAYHDTSSDLVTWESDSYEGSYVSFKQAVDDYLETRESLDKKPCKPQ